MKRVRNFVTLCGGRYPLGLKLNEAQAAPRLVSVRFVYGASRIYHTGVSVSGVTQNGFRPHR